MQARKQIDVVVRWGGTAIAVERLAIGESFTIGANGQGDRHFVCDHVALPPDAALHAHRAHARRRAPAHFERPRGARRRHTHSRRNGRATRSPDVWRASNVVGAPLSEPRGGGEVWVTYPFLMNLAG